MRRLLQRSCRWGSLPLTSHRQTARPLTPLWKRWRARLLQRQTCLSQIPLTLQRSRNIMSVGEYFQPDLYVGAADTLLFSLLFVCSFFCSLCCGFWDSPIKIGFIINFIIISQNISHKGFKKLYYKSVDLLFVIFVDFKHLINKILVK